MAAGKGGARSSGAGAAANTGMVKKPTWTAVGQPKGDPTQGRQMMKAGASGKGGPTITGTTTSNPQYGAAARNTGVTNPSWNAVGQPKGDPTQGRQMLNTSPVKPPQHGGLIGQIGDAYRNPLDFSGNQQVNLPGKNPVDVRTSDTKNLPTIRGTDFRNLPGVNVADTSKLPSISHGGNGQWQGIEFSNPFDSRYQGIDFTDNSNFQGVDFQRGTQGVNFQRGTQGVDFQRGTQGVDFQRGQQGVDFQRGTQGVDFQRGTQGVDFQRGQQGVDFSDPSQFHGVDTSRTNLMRDRQGLAGQYDQNYGDLGTRYGDIQNRFQFGDPNSYGAERKSMEDAMYQRAMNLLRPDLERQQSSINNDIANRGLAPTSQAAQSLQGQFSDQRDRTLNDLSLGAVMAGSQEHQRLADLTSRNRQQAFGEGLDMFGAGQARTSSLDALNQAEEAEQHRQYGRQIGLRGQEANEANQVALQQLGLRGIEAQEAGQLMNAQNQLRSTQAQEAGNIMSAQNQLRGTQAQEAGNIMASQLGLRGVEAQEAGQIMSAQNQLRGTQAQEAGQIMTAQNQLRGTQAQEAGQIMNAQNQLRSTQAQEAGNIMNAQLGLRGLQGSESNMRAQQQLGLRGMQGSETAQRAAQQLGLRQQQEQAAQRRMQAQIAARQAAMQAQQQKFSQEMQLRQQLGTEGGQRYGQDASARGQLFGEQQAQFGNDMAQRQQMQNEMNTQFGQQAQLRQQQIAEQMTQRAQPMNDLSSLLNVAPQGLPSMPGFTNYAIQSPDMMGMAGSNYASQANAHAAGKGGMGSAVGGLAGLFSDRRLKTNIKAVGKLYNGLKVYSYNFLGDDRTQIGLMADEVEEVKPHAVGEFKGFKTVDYRKAVV